MSENTAGGTVETPSVEELQAKLEAEQAARAKAEAKIVDLKKSTPEPEVKKEVIKEAPVNSTVDDMERFYNEKKFYEANPAMEEYKEKLSELTSKGNSLEDAKFLLEKNDPTIANRKIANQTNFTAWEPANNSKVDYTMDELKDLSQFEYNKVMELKAQGKVIIK